MTNNLSSDGWFHSYKGFGYANGPLDIHSRINNKVLIDRMKNPDNCFLCGDDGSFNELFSINVNHTALEKLRLDESGLMTVCEACHDNHFTV